MGADLARRLLRLAGYAGWSLLWVLGGCADAERRSGAPGLRVADVLGSDAVAGEFARADAPRTFEFPADHGPHLEFRSEWWYLTMALADSDGREFGVQFTLFRQARFPGGPARDPWRNGQGYLGHFAVTDVHTGRHREAERLARGHPALAGALVGIPPPRRAAPEGTPTTPKGTPANTTNAPEGTPTAQRTPTFAPGAASISPARPPLAIRAVDVGAYATPNARKGTPTKGTPTPQGTPACAPGGISATAVRSPAIGGADMTGGVDGDKAGVLLWLEGWCLAGDGDNWTLDAAADGFAVSMRLVATKPVILQGEGGLSAKGPGQASYYYSLPRLRASGHLQIDGDSHVVAGTGWLDREWSTSVLGEHQLGWDWFALMLDGGEDIMAFRLRREDGRRDPHDHGVLVDARGAAQYLASRDFNLTPVAYWRDERGTAWPVRWTLRVADRWWRIVAPVSDQRMDTLLTYWEGLVHVLDQQGTRVGSGYMELTGYR